jgi:predicted XRE-type DNA-binding protein
VVDTGCITLKDAQGVRDVRIALATADIGAALKGAELMQQIATIIEAEDWTQVEAAARCGVTQPRINDLLRGRVSRFSLDALVNIATALSRRVSVELAAV